MKKLFISTFALLMATNANAVNLRHYVALHVSDVVSGETDIEIVDIDTINRKTQENFGFSAAYGFKLSDFRTEIELNLYPPAKLKHTAGLKVQNTSIFVNGFYDIRTNSPFVPYIGAGVGYNRIKLSYASESDTSATLGAKIGFGVAWEVSRMFALDMGYRYNYFGEYSDDDDNTLNMYGHELYLGGRISF